MVAVRLAAAVALLLPVSPALAQEEDGSWGAFAERPAEYGELVDEDEQFAPRRQEYAFNPVQARNELKVGNYYAKKGSHRAAAGRYEEATRWDSNFAEAYWRLGMAQERLGKPREAIDAYSRYLGIEALGKRARSVRKRLERLQVSAGQLPLATSGTEPQIRNR